MDEGLTPFVAPLPHGPGRSKPPSAAAARQRTRQLPVGTDWPGDVASQANRPHQEHQRPRSTHAQGSFSSFSQPIRDARHRAAPRSASSSRQRHRTKDSGAPPLPPPTVTNSTSVNMHERDRLRAERKQKIQDLVQTIAALQLECAIDPSGDTPHVAPAADADQDPRARQRKKVKHRNRSMSPDPGTTRFQRLKSRPSSQPQSVVVPSSAHDRVILPSSGVSPPHYATPTVASQLHQRDAIPKPKSKSRSGGGSGPRHCQNSPTRTLPIPAGPSRPPPLELKSLALLRSIKLDTDPITKVARPRPLALPRPFLGLSRLEDLGSRPVGGASQNGGDAVGVGRSARVALHKAIEAQLEDLYRELDSDTGVYAGLGKEVKVADAVGPGFKAGIDDWELGADETMKI